MNPPWPLATGYQRTIEVLLLLAIVLSPWAFGSGNPTGEFYLTTALVACTVLFASWVVGDPNLRWRAGKLGAAWVSGLLLIALVAGLQLVPLPPSVRSSLSPGLANWTEAAAQTDLPGVDDGIAQAEDVQNLWTAGSCLSLYPDGSRQAALRLGLLASIFVIVAHLNHPGLTLRRLCVVSSFLGTALALFGLAQHYGSRDGLIYWTFPVDGGLGFGPFINRNHYPFFLNLLLGLSIGLLIERLESMGRSWQRLIFNDPAVAWLLAAIGFMVASLIVCVSRGGILSGWLAISAVLMLRIRAKDLGRNLAIGVAVLAVITVVLIWLGFEFRESRLTMLTEVDKYGGDGRWYLWQTALQSVPQFPWLGSGGETFQYWDSIYQLGGAAWNSSYRMAIRADNEFLDVLNEYGLVGLIGLLVATVAMILGCVPPVGEVVAARGGHRFAGRHPAQHRGLWTSHPRHGGSCNRRRVASAESAACRRPPPFEQPGSPPGPSNGTRCRGRQHGGRRL